MRIGFVRREGGWAWRAASCVWPSTAFRRARMVSRGPRCPRPCAPDLHSTHRPDLPPRNTQTAAARRPRPPLLHRRRGRRAAHRQARRRRRALHALRIGAPRHLLQGPRRQRDRVRGGSGALALTGPPCGPPWLAKPAPGLGPAVLGPSASMAAGSFKKQQSAPRRGPHRTFCRPCTMLRRRGRQEPACVPAFQPRPAL
jgi:hypothetical protein